MLVTEIEKKASTQDATLEALRSHLMRCGVVISMGCNSDADVTAAKSCDPARVVSALAEIVEERTGGRVTVRQAHPAVVLKAEAETIYVVRCFTDEVSEDRDAMVEARLAALAA